MKSRSRCVLAPTALAFWIAASPSGRLGGGRRVVRIVEQAERDAPIGDAAFRIGLDRPPRRCSFDSRYQNECW